MADIVTEQQLKESIVCDATCGRRASAAPRSRTPTRRDRGGRPAHRADKETSGMRSSPSGRATRAPSTACGRPRFSRSRPDRVPRALESSIRPRCIPEEEVDAFRAARAGRRVAVDVALLWLALPAGAGAKSKVLKPVSYPGMTTYSCRTDAITIYPGQNLNLFGVTKTCPNAREGERAGRRDVFRPGSTARATSPASSRAWSRSTRTAGGRRRASGTCTSTTSSGCRPTGARPSPPARRRPIEAPAGLRHQGRRGRDLGPQLHDPQPDRGWRAAGLDHVGDRLGTGDSPGAHRHQPVYGPARCRGAAADLPVFDAERGFDPTATASTCSRTRSRTTRRRPASRSAQDQSRPQVDGSRRGRTLVSGVGHLHPGGLNVDLEVARDGPDAGTVDGDGPSEVRKLFRSDAKYYEPAGAVSWDVSMKATRRGWRIALKAGDTVSIDTTYDVERASWYESMGILPLAVSAPADPLAKDPFDDRRGREGDVRRGRHPHPRPPAREHRRPRSATRPGPARSSRPAQQRDRRVVGDPDRRLPLLRGRLLGDPWLLLVADAPAGDRARATRHLHQPRRAADDAQTTSRPGTASPRASRPATAARGSATRSRPGRSSSTRGQLGFGTLASSR